MLASYVACGLLCTVLLVLCFDLSAADFRVPFFYEIGWDLSIMNMFTKSILDCGWYLHNPHLGAPGQLELYDFPLIVFLHASFLKMIGMAVSDYGTVLNIYFLLSFYLEAWTFLFVLRRFGIPSHIAVVTALLFAFQPFHFFRGPVALTYGAGIYFCVPLILMVTLWVCLGEPLFFTCNGRRVRWRRPDQQSWLAAITCIMISGCAAYDAFFGAFFIATSGVIAATRRNAAARILDTCFLLLLVVGSFMLSYWPTIRYTRIHAPNPEVARRDPNEAVTHGLSIFNMMMPFPGHRIPTEANLIKLSNAYPTTTEVLSAGTENKYCYLGFIGVLGFLALLRAWNELTVIACRHCP
jgi:hypothetical protein